MGTHFEAVCGQCGAEIYETLGGALITEISCPRCRAKNFFARPTGERDVVRRVRLVGTLDGSANTATVLNAGDR
jgi:DNA-directed RNA polymerase subunit RPC12/RpoP